MVNYMITIVPNMSWERLAAYLYFTENQTALTEVKKYFQKQLGMWIRKQKTILKCSQTQWIKEPLFIFYWLLAHCTSNTQL